MLVSGELGAGVGCGERRQSRCQSPAGMVCLRMTHGPVKEGCTGDVKPPGRCGGNVPTLRLRGGEMGRGGCVSLSWRDFRGWDMDIGRGW